MPKTRFFYIFFLLQPPTVSLPRLPLGFSLAFILSPLFYSPIPLRVSFARRPSLLIPYFISVPSRPPLILRLYHRGSPVVGSADFFLGYRPVDRAAIRWTAIRIDYSLPKLRRGAFILYNSPEALVPSSLSLSSLASSSLAITARRRSSRARRHPMRSLARAVRLYA